MSYFTQLNRLIWKEYRSLRTIWLAVLFAGLLLELLAYMTIHPSLNMRDDSIMSITFMIPICFSIGCALQMFSGEKSDQSFSYLLFLPIRPSVILVGKFIFGGFLTFLMALPMFYLAKLLCDRMLFIDGVLFVNKTYTILFFFIQILLYVLAIFCSLVCSSAQKSLKLFFGICFVYILLPSAGLDKYHSFIPNYLMSLAFILPLTVIINIILLRPWVRRLNPVKFSFLRLEFKWKKLKRRSRFKATEYTFDPFLRFLHRFFWKEWKSLRWLYCFCFLSLLLFSNVFLAAQIETSQRYQVTSVIFLFTSSIPLFGITLFSPLFVFHSEQQNKRYLYLSNRGYSPGLYWTLKHLLWFMPILITITLMYLLQSFSAGIYRISPGYQMIDYTVLFSHLLIIYSIGQFSSVIDSSNQHIHFSEAFPTPTGVVYPSEMSFLSSANLNDSEDSYAKETAQLYRDIVKKITSLPRLTDHLINDTCDIHRKQIDLWKELEANKPEYLKWHSLHQDKIPEIIEIAKRKSCLFIDFTFNSHNFKKWGPPENWVMKTWNDLIPDLSNLQTLLFLHAKKLESENRLKEARDVYLAIFGINNHVYEKCGSYHLTGRGDSPLYEPNTNYKMLNSWLDHPNQTIELLKESYQLFKKKFEEVNDKPFYYDSNYANRNNTYHYFLKHDPPKSEETKNNLKTHLFGNYRFDLKTIAYLDYYKERSVLNSVNNKSPFQTSSKPDENLNLFDYAILKVTTEQKRREKILKNNLVIKLSQLDSFRYWNPGHSYRASYDAWNENQQNKTHSMYLAEKIRHTDIVINKDFKYPFFLKPIIDIESRQREILTRLVIKWYIMKNEKPPESLEKLVKEGYLSEIPKSPYLWNVPFTYHPNAIVGDDSDANKKVKENINTYTAKPILYYRTKENQTLILNEIYHQKDKKDIAIYTKTPVLDFSQSAY